MKIAVIAANGRSGRTFVKAALAAGHTVTAGVLGKHDLRQHPRLTIMPCDATIHAELQQLLRGQDAVVSFIGHVKSSPAHVQTDAMHAIIDVMKHLRITRIVSLTGTGVRFTGDRITFMDRLLNWAVSLIDPERIKDGRDHVEVLKMSDLEWTVIRVLKLQNIAPSIFALREHGPTKLMVSREDVAHAVLQVLDDRSFVRQAPIIGRV